MFKSLVWSEMTSIRRICPGIVLHCSVPFAVRNATTEQLSSTVQSECQDLRAILLSC